MSLILNELLIKGIVTLIFSAFLFLLKPIRKRIIKFFKRITGKTKYSVTVKGYILFINHNRNIYNFFNHVAEERFYYEVELFDIKDISEDAIPIEQSNYLIYMAIKNKYGKDFSNKGGMLNITSIKKNEN